MANTKPLLDLATVIDRPTIKIDNKTYEMLAPDELPALTRHRIGNWFIDADKIFDGEDEADDAADRIEAMLGRITDAILPSVPAEVRARLNSQQRLAIASAFIALPRMTLRTPTPTAAKSTGAKPPQPSPGSTAATRGTG